MEKNSATIKDIAKKAGVSVGTVSKVFNNYPDVGDRTRIKILNIAEQLGYSPGITARSLIKNGIKRVGLFVEDYIEEDISSRLAFDIMMGFKRVMLHKGCEVLLLTTTTDTQKRTRISDLISANSLDGAFIIGLKLSDPYYEEVKRGSFPCVLYDVPVERDRASSVEVDNLKGAMRATEYLVQLGHRKIALINGHKDAYVSEERLHGYYLGLIKNNIPVDANLVFESDFSELGGQRAMECLLKYDGSITAVFAASDLMAIGAMKYLQGIGKKVPDDISIVGFDDIESASFTTPSITTMKQNRRKIGEIAANVLINLVKGENFGRVLVEADLVVRESTGKNGGIFAVENGISG